MSPRKKHKHEHNPYDPHTEAFMHAILGEHKNKSGTLSAAGKQILRPLVRAVKGSKRNLIKFLTLRTAREVMEKDGSMNVVGVYKYMNEQHGRLWWDWEPETIWATLEGHHLTEGTPDEIKNMVMALQLVLNTFGPFEHWHIFEKVSHAFNENHVDFSVLQPAEPDEAAFTMKVLSLIRPQTDYAPEVLIYIATCANHAGMVYLPEELFPGVQTHLDAMTHDYLLRDATKKAWEKKDASEERVAIQIGRLQEVKELVDTLG